MSTSSSSTSFPILSLSEFTRLMSERHHHFLSQSLERYREELHFLELTIMNFRQSNHTESTTTSSPGSTPFPPSNIEIQPRQSFNNRMTDVGLSAHPIYDDEIRHEEYWGYSEPVVASTPIPTPSPLSDVEIQPRRRSLNRMSDIGSSNNPIYVFDDNEIRCEGCWEDGHFIGDCNREYRFDGIRYVAIPKGENPMEPTYVVDEDYYRREGPILQAESGKSTTLIG